MIKSDCSGCIHNDVCSLKTNYMDLSDDLRECLGNRIVPAYKEFFLLELRCNQHYLASGTKLPINYQRTMSKLFECVQGKEGEEGEEEHE